MEEVGILFLIAGFMGFIQNPLFGIFEVDFLHTVFHIFSGVVAFIFSFQDEEGAERGASILAFVYGVVAVVGFIVPDNSLLGIMSINTADNWLHLFTVLVFLYIGYMPAVQEKNIGV